MKKIKDHYLSKNKTFGNPFKKEVMGIRSERGVLNEWPDYAWKMPDPVKKSRKSTMYD
tara:strand:+ start:273 stop:446 length:174 start_codon:yes stop_codon:yes gene_type:complete